MRKEIRTKRFQGAAGERSYISANKITLGADPEFELIDRNGSVMNASYSHVPHSTRQHIGVDGAGSQIELRPRKAVRPTALVAEMNRLLVSFRERFPRYSLSIKGNTYSLGGHLHIGVRGATLSDDQMIDLVHLFDDFLGRPTLQMTGEARIRGGYHGLTKWRRQPHGLEYRSPSANVFRTPEFLRIVLKMVKNITFHYLNEDVLVYNDRPAFTDYHKLAELTQAEYDTFFVTIADDMDQHARKNLMSLWAVDDVTGDTAPVVQSGIRPASQPITTPREPRMDVQFSDDWNSTIRTEIRNMLAERNLDVPVGLFGLRQDRGRVVAGLSLQGFMRTDHSLAGLHSGRHMFGLSWELRNNLSVFNVHKAELIVNIMETIAVRRG